MPLSFLSPAPGWTLHMYPHLGCAGTLVYHFDATLVCKVPLKPAHASLLLALAACRSIDQHDGQVEDVGCRSLAELGVIVAAVPGSGNCVAGNTVGGYKREINRRVVEALETLSLEVGRPLRAPLPIDHPRYNLGYCLGEAGLTLTGVELAAITSAVRAANVDHPEHGFPHH